MIAVTSVVKKNILRGPVCFRHSEASVKICCVSVLYAYINVGSLQTQHIEPHSE